MMNNANEISKETKLFGYIGEHAGASRFGAVLNKRFKAEGKDAMMIPMNIREDDFYFTLSNMKKSHLSGAVIANEYVTRVLELLDDASALVRRSGMCDLVLKEGEKLRGELFGMRALSEYLKDLRARKIALIGTNAHAKAFSFLACGFEVDYFHDNLEELMAFTKEVELEAADMNRIGEGMQIDLSGYDAVLDFSNLANFSMVQKLGMVNLDMKSTKEFSPLRQRASELGASYTSYDDMIEKLTQAVYRVIY